MPLRNTDSLCCHSRPMPLGSIPSRSSGAGFGKTYYTMLTRASRSNNCACRSTLGLPSLKTAPFISFTTVVFSRSTNFSLYQYYFVKLQNRGGRLKSKPATSVVNEPWQIYHPVISQISSPTHLPAVVSLAGVDQTTLYLNFQTTNSRCPSC